MKHPKIPSCTACISQKITVSTLLITFFGAMLSTGRGWSAIQTPPQPEKHPQKLAINYNPGFIHGSGVDVSRFAKQNVVMPGMYDVVVIVNGKDRGKHSILFKLPENEDQFSAEPCFTLQQLEQVGIILDKKEKSLNQDQDDDFPQCRFLNFWISEGSSDYDQSDFELSLRVPQLNVKEFPRGYIDPSLWEAGETVGFLDYNVNAGLQSGKSRNNSYYGNLGVTGGINFAGWRLRKRINSSWDKEQSTHTQNLYGFVERDITVLKSQLVLGDGTTSGDIFDSYSLRGVLLGTDDRMLPDSLRNYTPILRGVAETNARVVVMQRGLKIYETTVPPGPFEFRDIGMMSYSGDLEMIITEADGRQRRQTISFSAPPMLLRQGVSRFAVSAGQLNEDTIRKRYAIMQGSYHYGLSNRWTLYVGTQISKKYYAFALGNAINTPIGGVSFGVIHAQSDLGGRRRVSGNNYQVNFTKDLWRTDTSLTLTASRSSSEGFYTFSDASRTRQAKQVNAGYYDSRIRDRVSATISQHFYKNVTLYLNGSWSSYWNDRPSSRQYSISLSHALRYFSYGLTATRLRNENGKDENNYLLSVNIPLGDRSMFHKPLFDSIYSTFSRDSRGHNLFQTALNGSQGEQNALSYGIGGSMGNSDADRAVHGNLDYRSSVGRFGMTGSLNTEQERQFSVSADSSLVVHKGGVTAGPAIGTSPFAIVKAKGATGAPLMNGHGGKIGADGYAIMSSLSPYRRNTILVEPNKLPDSVDVLENSKEVIPRAGAAIVVNMKTIIGKPLVLITRDDNQAFLPIGTDLQNAEGISQGVVGQRGMAFVRGWEPATQPLYAILNDKKLSCKPTRDDAMKLTNDAQHMQITQLEVTCLQG